VVGSTRFFGPTGWAGGQGLALAIPDVIPPTVLSFSPADNATGVSVSTDLVATMSEVVVLGASGIISLKKTSDNSVIQTWNVATQSGTGAGQVSVVGGTALTMRLTLPIGGTTEHYVIWDAGVVKDTSNNNVAALSVTTTWSFTTGAAADGSTAAPTGTANFPTILNSYGGGGSRNKGLIGGTQYQPPWNVAGVDYRVGINTGVTLKNATTDTLPSGVTRSIDTTTFPGYEAANWLVSGNNVVVDGWDFTNAGTGHNWAVKVTGNNCTIKNCKFILSAVIPPAYPSGSLGIITFDTCTGGTIEYCEITGSGPYEYAPRAVLIFSAGGTWNIRYNYIKLIAFSTFTIGASTNNTGMNYAGSFYLRYNLIENVAQSGYKDAHGDHMSMLALSSGNWSKFDNLCVEYNTLYQTSMNVAAVQASNVNASPCGNYSGTRAFAYTQSVGDVESVVATFVFNTMVTPLGPDGPLHGVSLSPLVTYDYTQVSGTHTIGHNFFDPGGLALSYGTYAAPAWTAKDIFVSATPVGHFSGTVTIETTNVNMLTGAVVANFNAPAPSGTTTYTVFLTTASSSPWTVPAGVSSLDSVECIGAGGGGAGAQNTAQAGAGGGAGAYAARTAVAVTALSTIAFSVGAKGTGGLGGGTGGSGGNGGDTSFSSGSAVIAKGGSGGVGVTLGAGGTAAGSTGVTKFNGGSGGAHSGAPYGASGGGGAGGPLGAGGAGGSTTTNNGSSGAGGGGSGGGTAGLTNGIVTAAGSTGGGSDRGAGFDSGVGATFDSGNPSSAGSSVANHSAGGGGGGSSGGTPGNNLSGAAGAGGAGQEWDSTHGSGGGGGGGAGGPTVPGSAAGIGGNYGGAGGGGGASTTGSGASAGGNGADGVIRIVYTV